MNKNTVTTTAAVVVIIAAAIIAATLVISTPQSAAAFRTRGELQSGGQENEGKPACGQTNDAAGPCASNEVPDAPGKFQPPNPPGELVCFSRPSSSQCNVPS